MGKEVSGWSDHTTRDESNGHSLTTGREVMVIAQHGRPTRVWAGHRRQGGEAAAGLRARMEQRVMAGSCGSTTATGIAHVVWRSTLSHTSRSSPCIVGGV